MRLRQALGRALDAVRVARAPVLLHHFFIVGVLMLTASLAHATLVAPVLDGEAVIVPPPDAPDLKEPVQVRARITLDATGEVQKVELLEGAHGPFAEAVLVGATRFHFSPAMQDGVPVPAALDLTQTFEPARPTAVVPNRPVAVLRGTVVETGTRRPVPTARVQVDTPDGPVRAITDALGNFELGVPAGLPEVHVAAVGYRAFMVHETLQPNDVLTVRYFVERLQYDPYESVVIGRHDNADTSRTSLSGREIYTIPGTFGDPFRVITSLPGVGTMISILGYPIVRGTSPGSTGLMIDNVPVPELFHLLAGPSIMHPEFIDRVDFYPGTYPLRYGGYVGGIVDGITRRPRPDEKRLDIDVDLLQAGGFARWPILGPGKMVGTVAARYGYPAGILKLTHSPINLDYWDYQARLDGSLWDGQFKVFAFGGGDNLITTSGGATSIAFDTAFHRLNLAYEHASGPVSGSYAVYLGIDNSTIGAVVDDLKTLSVAPYLRWKWGINDVVRLNWGIDGNYSTFSGYLNLYNQSLQNHLYDTGGFVELPLQLNDALTLTPGVRADLFQNATAGTKVGVDPRLGMRWRVDRAERGDAYIKAGVGQFHQSPKMIVPIPGLEQGLNLSAGLEDAWQSMVGAEIPIATGIDVDVQVYYNYANPILYDLASNTNPFSLDPNSSQSVNNATLFGSVTTPQIGRAYGLELILRHRDMGKLFGWISYTLSRTERRFDNRWVPWDYDRTHMVQAVAGMSLPRNWQFGLRLGVETGRPISSTNGYNDLRSPGFARLDMRIDKRTVWRDWMLDFYIDIINLTLTPEFIDQASIAPRYILPTIGLRAVL